MQLFAFVDTNVLLHFQFFADVDWAKQFGVDAVTLVFAPVVLAELDQHKWGGSRREKTRAKAVLKRLDALNLSPSAVAVRPGVSAMALIAEPPDSVFAQHRLDAHVGDDRLLASVLSFDGAAPGDRVLILTGDSGLRVKARGRQLEVAAPDESLELPDEPDETERELQKAQRELAESRSASPELKLGFGDGETHAQFTVRLVRDFDALTLSRLLKEWRQKHSHIGGMADTIDLPFGGGQIRTSSFARMAGFVSAEDARFHNSELDGVYARYEKYLRAWPATVNVIARVLPLNLILENTGTAPADDIDVQLWTDAPGQWIDEMPELPLPPQPPERRSPLEGLYNLDVNRFDYMRHNNLIQPAANEDGPNIDGDGQGVQYGIERVKHHVPCELPVVYFQFASEEAVASFTLNVRIVAANIRKPSERTLQLQIVREEPIAAPEPAILLSQAAEHEDEDEDE